MRIPMDLHGLAMTSWSQYPGARFALFRPGENMAGGDVVVFDPTAALNVGGKLATVKLTTSALDPLVVGVVADFVGSVVSGGQVLIQVSGLHPGVQCDGTTDLAAGDNVSTFSSKGQASKVTAFDRRAFGIYVDAAYTTNAVAAKKKVIILNPQGIVPLQIT